MTEKQVAEFFVEQRVLEPSQADDVLSEVELNGKTVAQALIDGGFIDESSFYLPTVRKREADFLRGMDVRSGAIGDSTLVRSNRETQ